MATEPRPDEDQSNEQGADESEPPPTANQERGRKFHEATGSLRDLGIAILLLVLLYVVVYFTLLR